MTREIRTKIRGVSFPDEHSGLERQEIIRRWVRPGMDLELGPDPESRYGLEGIGVWLVRQEPKGEKRYQLGWLGSELTDRLAKGAKKIGRMDAVVSEVTGGVKGKETRGVNIVVRLEPAGKDAPPRPQVESAAEIKAPVEPAAPATARVSGVKVGRFRLPLWLVLLALAALGCGLCTLIAAITGQGG